MSKIKEKYEEQCREIQSTFKQIVDGNKKINEEEKKKIDELNENFSKHLDEIKEKMNEEEKETEVKAKENEEIRSKLQDRIKDYEKMEEEYQKNCQSQSKSYLFL